MTDETKGDVVTLEVAIALIDDILGIKGYCSYRQAEAWNLIRSSLAAQSAMRVDDAIKRLPLRWLVAADQDNEAVFKAYVTCANELRAALQAALAKE